MNTKDRRNSGRYIPHYEENLPMQLREELDIEEHRVMWSDWVDCRDGQRMPRERNYYKKRYR